MPLIRDHIPSEAKDRMRKVLLRIRDSAVELQNIAGEMEGLKAIFLDGIASRIINLADIALKEI